MPSRSRLPPFRLLTTALAIMIYRWYLLGRGAAEPVQKKADEAIQKKLDELLRLRR